MIRDLAQDQAVQDIRFSVKWKVCTRHVYESHLQVDHLGIPTVLREIHFAESPSTHSFFLSYFVVIFPIIPFKF